MDSLFKNLYIQRISETIAIYDPSETGLKTKLHQIYIVNDIDSPAHSTVYGVRFRQLLEERHAARSEFGDGTGDVLQGRARL